MIRKGLGLGQGKGYRNIIPQYDSYVHSLSARGMKTTRQYLRPLKRELSPPKLKILSEQQFEKKFEDDYKPNEVGYATTKIYPDGSSTIYLKDSGDFERNMKLIAHEFNELSIWHNLVNEQGIDPQKADEMAHNLNEVKIKGVIDYYPIDLNN